MAIATRIGITAALALAHFGGTAAGAVVPLHTWPPSLTARVGLALPTARAAWPTSPCRGREQFSEVANLELIGGQAILDGTCRVVIATGEDPATFCMVMTHELGHLAGAGHSPNPNSVMSPTGPENGYEPCEIAMARYAQSPMPIVDAIDQLPQARWACSRGGRWVVDCHSAKGSVRVTLEWDTARRWTTYLIHWT